MYVLDPALSTTGYKYDLVPSRGVKIKANLHRGKEQFYYPLGKKSSYSRKTSETPKPELPRIWLEMSENRLVTCRGMSLETT